MDENEFRTTYRGLNPDRCVYEKSILTQSCHCEHASRINIAERVGIGCKKSSAREQCASFLNPLRQQASFALKLTRITGNLLPHSKEVQVQKGGLVGLSPGLDNNREAVIDNIHALINAAATRCEHDFEQYPFNELITSIAHHEVPKRRQRKREKS